MERLTVLKALADETRLKIATLLLAQPYRIRALTKNLQSSEAAISQHIKVRKVAKLLTSERHGHFMHYRVECAILRQLAASIEVLAAIERSTSADLAPAGHKKSRACGKKISIIRCGKHESCKCRKS